MCWRPFALHRLENVLETMHFARNQLSGADPGWVQAHVAADWYAHYGLRAEQSRLPKDQSKRDALACTIGGDGYQLLRWVFAPETPQRLRQLPAIEILRQVWIQQFYHSTVPGSETLRWRSLAEEPPPSLLIQSPYDLEARYSSKRATHWVGYKVHLSETCDDGHPDLLTQVVTTAATTPDTTMGPLLQQDLADRALLPGIHLLDSGYVDSQLLVTAEGTHQVDVVGPTVGSYSWQRLAGQGYDLHAFSLDWERHEARCPQGQTSVKWTPGVDVSGDPVVRIRFDRATCQACPARSVCTSAVDKPRQLTVRPQAQHEAIARARHRQATAAFQVQYALRSGVESCISQGVRRFGLRHSCFRGLARTHLQHLLMAVALNLVRVIAWLWNATRGEQRRPAGSHFARLAPRPLSRQALIC